LGFAYLTSFQIDFLKLIVHISIAAFTQEILAYFLRGKSLPYYWPQQRKYLK